MSLTVTINIIQIILSVALVIAIVLQSKGAGLGGLTGGSDGGGVFRARRGVEKLLFNVTIGLSVAFFACAILNVILTNQQ